MEKNLLVIVEQKDQFVKTAGTIKKRKGFVSRLINTGSVTGNNAISYMDNRERCSGFVVTNNAISYMDIEDRHHHQSDKKESAPPPKRLKC